MDEEPSEHRMWFSELQPVYGRLGEAAVSILKQVLLDADLDILAISSRAKSIASFSEKLTRKRYKSPATEMTDLCGVRMVTYLESDVSRVVDLIKSTFGVDAANSVDKSQDLAPDRVGYRSVHLVCRLGNGRTALSEYRAFRDLHFEVQVRTALQHAWAQIEHDRNYKFGGVLPKDLQRRLHLAAGALELVDREFDQIAADVEAYAKQISLDAQTGTPDVDLNTTSLRSLIGSRAGDQLRYHFEPLSGSNAQRAVIDELRKFGVKSLRDVAALMTQEFFDARNKYPEPDGITNELGLLRDAMMFADLERYLKVAYDKTWGVMDPMTRAMLATRYGSDRLSELLDRHNMEIQTSGFNEDA
jgi:ppGpp synthetase/RelA/SpoT-type nucleotidyltranferase